MKYKLIIHSVDLQEHDRFLEFLYANTLNGYEPFRIYRTCSLFRKTDSPPKGFSMIFCPEGSLRNAAKIKGLENGIEIYATSQHGIELAPTWEKDVVNNYQIFTGFNNLSFLRSISRHIIYPLVLLVLLLGNQYLAQDMFLAMANGFSVHSNIIALFLIFVGLTLLTKTLAFIINQFHKKGLDAAMLTPEPYIAPTHIRKLILVKNFINLFYVIPAVTLVIMILPQIV